MSSAPVMFTVPPVPFMVPLVRFAVVKLPPRFTVPPAVAMMLPEFVHVVAPEPSVSELVPPVAINVPLLVTEPLLL